MRKSIVALLGLAAMMSACGGPKLVGAPVAANPAAAAASLLNNDLDHAEKLFNLLQARFNIDAPSTMCLSSRTYGPAFGFVTVAKNAADQTLTEVNTGTITNDGKITTMISFASRLNRAKNPQIDEATAAIKQRITQKMGTEIKQFIISTNPTGHDKFAYLAIGSQPKSDNPDLTWYHAGTYAVGTKQINQITDFGTNIVK